MQKKLQFIVKSYLFLPNAKKLALLHSPADSVLEKLFFWCSLNKFLEGSIGK